MPWKPTSHAQRKGRTASDRTYDAQRHDSVAVQVRNSGRWQRLRTLVLAKHPLCADPFGVHGSAIVPATQVDHLAPLEQRPDLAFTLENLQALCASCHARKSQGERLEASKA